MKEAIEWWNEELATATKRSFLNYYFPELQGVEWPRIDAGMVEYIFDIETDPDQRKCPW